MQEQESSTNVEGTENVFGDRCPARSRRGHGALRATPTPANYACYQSLLTSVATFVFTWALTPALWAAEERAHEPGRAAEILYAVVPLILIGALLWWFLRKSQKSPFMQRSVGYYERSEQHMERLEQLLERIATALERKDKDAGG